MYAAPFLNEAYHSTFARKLAEIAAATVDLELATRAGAIPRAVAIEAKLVRMHAEFLRFYEVKDVVKAEESEPQCGREWQRP